MQHHALCVTEDVDTTAAVLASVSPALFSVMLGDAAATIELAPLPAELNGRLVPGTTSISFAVDDLDERVAACRAAGLDVIVDVEPASGLAFAVVTVAGLEFELVAC